MISGMDTTSRIMRLRLSQVIGSSLASFYKYASLF